MLEIIVNGVAVDLHVDISVNITIENPFMLEDRIPAPYSLTFDLPPTAKNLTIFGYPNRMATYNQDKIDLKFNCVIRFSAINIAVGQLKLGAYNAGIKVTFLGFDADEDLRKKIFDYDFGQEIFPGSFSPFNYKDKSNFAYSYQEWAINASKGLNEKLVVAPLAIDSSHEFLKATFPFRYSSPHRGNETVHAGYRSPASHQNEGYINMFNPVTQNFVVNGQTGAEQLIHAPIFPQFRVGWLLDKVFNQLFENPFLIDELKNLVLPTTYFPEWRVRTTSIGMGNYSPTQVTPPLTSNLVWERVAGSRVDRAVYKSQPYIVLADFMPDVYANDLLRDLLKTFSFHLILINGKFGIRRSKDILANPVKKDWSNKIIEQPELINIAGKEYQYGYSNKENSSEKDFEAAITVATLYDMVIVDFNPKEEFSAVYYVTERKSYYRVETIISKVLEWNLGTVGEPKDNEPVLRITYLGSEKKQNDSAKTDKYNSEVGLLMPKIVPVPFFVDTVRIKGFPKTYYYRTPLITTNRTQRPDNISFIFYDGQKPINKAIDGISRTYPALSSTNGSISLDWEGENGLIEKFHKEFKGWMEKPKLKVSGKFLLNSIDLHQLDITEKIFVNSRKFFIEKIQFTLRHNQIEPALVSLIEA